MFDSQAGFLMRTLYKLQSPSKLRDCCLGSHLSFSPHGFQLTYLQTCLLLICGGIEHSAGHMTYTGPGGKAERLEMDEMLSYCCSKLEDLHVDSALFMSADSAFIHVNGLSSCAYE